MRSHPIFRPLLLLAALLLLGFWILAPIYGRSRQLEARASCASHAKQIALAYMQYVEDSELPFPAASITNRGKGWADLLVPYAKDWTVFQCPAGEDATGPRQTDYFYNARLAKARSIPYPNDTILFADGYDNSGPNAQLAALPSDWKNNPNSSGRRHQEVFLCVHVSGMMKYWRYDQVSTQSPAATPSSWEPTFATQ